MDTFIVFHIWLGPCKHRIPVCLCKAVAGDIILDVCVKDT